MSAIAEIAKQIYEQGGRDVAFDLYAGHNSGYLAAVTIAHRASPTAGDTELALAVKIVIEIWKADNAFEMIEHHRPMLIPGGWPKEIPWPR